MLNDFVFLRKSIIFEDKLFPKITERYNLSNRACESLLLLRDNGLDHIKCPNYLRPAINTLLQYYAREKLYVNPALHRYLGYCVGRLPPLLPSKALQEKLSNGLMIVPAVTASTTAPELPSIVPVVAAPAPTIKSTAPELLRHDPHSIEKALEKMKEGQNEYEHNQSFIAMTHFNEALGYIKIAHHNMNQFSPPETETIKKSLVSIHWNLSSCYLKASEKYPRDHEKYHKQAWENLNLCICFEENFFGKVVEKRLKRLDEMKIKHPELATTPVSAAPPKVSAAATATSAFWAPPQAAAASQAQPNLQNLKPIF